MPRPRGDQVANRPAASTLSARALGPPVVSNRPGRATQRLGLGWRSLRRPGGGTRPTGGSSPPGWGRLPGATGGWPRSAATPAPAPTGPDAPGTRPRRTSRRARHAPTLDPPVRPGEVEHAFGRRLRPRQARQPVHDLDRRRPAGRPLPGQPEHLGQPRPVGPVLIERGRGRRRPRLDPPAARVPRRGDLGVPVPLLPTPGGKIAALGGGRGGVRTGRWRRGWSGRRGRRRGSAPAARRGGTGVRAGRGVGRGGEEFEERAGHTRESGWEE